MWAKANAELLKSLDVSSKDACGLKAISEVLRA